MILLSRYLLAQFVVNFITVASGFVSIYLLVDFFEKIDKFTEHGGSLALAIKFFLLNIPFILDQLGPVLILLSGVITLGVLNHNNELRALKAGGVPLSKIVKPIIIGSICSTIIFLAAAQWLLPRSIATTNQIWYEQLQGKVPLGIHRSGRYYYRGAGGFYSFEWPDPKKLSFKNFSYSCWNEKYNLRLLLNSEMAQWTNNLWIFSNGQTQTLDGDGIYHYDTFTSKEDVLPESPEHFFIPEYESAEMSITDLFLETQRKDTEDEKQLAKANFYSRISYIFLGIPLLLLGLPVLILSYNKWGRDLSIAIPASCGLAFIAWGFWGALQSLAKVGYLSPVIAAVAIHLIFAAIGLVLLQQQNK